jgi:RNA polymerase sigma-70 factor (ECF subfamily)
MGRWEAADIARAEGQVSDDELMERVARGDEEAARLLVERWEAALFAFLARMLGSREDAQDAGQETFIRLFSQAGRYRPSGQFRSWLFRIAGNLARSRLRRRRIVSWVSFSPGKHDRPSAGDGPDAGVERAETESAVGRAIAGLPERQRQAIVLRHYQGLGYREIASVMGISLAAVESLLQRGTAALRVELGRKGVKR